VLSRLTYSNVVATLALFIALGGSAYAAGHITSRDVKDRSLRGKDIRRNTLTGKEVKESKLGRVPRAKSATTAGSAARATTAGTAGTANRATTAGTADGAKNANALGGLGAGSFEKSSRIQTARVTPTAAPGTPVMEWPEFGVKLEVPTQGGCGDPLQTTLRISSTRDAGEPDIHVFGGASSNISLSAGSSSIARSADLRRWIGVVTSEEDDNRTLFFSCFRTGSEVSCVGTRSEP